MGRTQKINIGMSFYGNVSFAIYEAGMAEELIRFVQFCKNSGKEIPSIDIHVTSGTSAGGLIALLMSVTLANSSDPSFHIQEMRRIWFDVTDLSMLQHKGNQDVHSFLNNDIIENEVKKFLQIKNSGEGLCRDIKTLIACTNMHGLFDIVPTERSPLNITEKYERVIPAIHHIEVFEFDGHELRDSSYNKKTIEKISKIARITFSFPAAFPPQFFQSPSFPEETYKRITNKENPLHFWYIDGGMLDNRPLGRAIDYIELNKKEGEWWYFFAEPQPNGNKLLHKEWTSNPENPPDPFTTLVTILEVWEAEKIYYDLKHIEKMNHQAVQVNNLVSEIISLFYDNYPDIYKKGNNIFKRMRENVKTTYLSYLLPDYIKCVTLFRYRFLRKEEPDNEKEIYAREIKARHDAIIENIQPLDPRRIIRECCLQIKDKRIFKDISNETIDGIKNTFISENSSILEVYDKAVEYVRNMQLLFRQISFWIEDDFKVNKKKPSQETWKEFVYAWARLDEALKSLNKVYKEAESIIQKRFFGSNKDLMKRVILHILLDEYVHTSFNSQIREQIKIVRIYHNEHHGSLIGTKMMNFAALLDNRWRKNDYFIGKKDAREMLKGKMSREIFSDNFWSDYDAWCDERELEIEERYRLTYKDIIKNPEEKEINSLPAGRVIPQINRILKTFEELISKYREKPFYHQLRMVQVHLMLPLLRFILWLIRQATAQPMRNNDKKNTSTIADFKISGRRSMGFILIGIIVGLLISFYLPEIFPDMIKEGARYIYNGIIKFIKHLKEF